MAKSKKELKTSGVVVKLTEFFQNAFCVFTLSEYQEYYANWLTHYTMSVNNGGIPKYKRYASAYIVKEWLDSATPISVLKSAKLCGAFSIKKSNTWNGIKPHIAWLRNQQSICCSIDKDNMVILPHIDSIAY